MRRGIHFATIVLALILAIGLHGDAIGDVAGQLKDADEAAKTGDLQQAAQIYREVATAQAGTDYGIQAIEKLTCLYAEAGKEADVREGLEELLSRYQGHKLLSTAVTHVGDAYRSAGRHERACQVYRDAIAAWPQDEHAMWSQMGLTISYASLGNNAAAQSAFALLRSQYTGQKHISRAVCLVGDHYRKLQKHKRACELYEDVLSNWPDAEFALWSRMGLAISRIRLRDGAAAKAAVERLRADFPQDERIPVAMCMAADEYRAVGQYEEACELYQRVVSNYPQAEHALWSQMNLAVSNIRLGRYDSAKAAADKLLGDFSQDERLPLAARTLGDEYRQKGKYAEAFELYENIVENQPDTKDAMWSQMNLAISKIGLPSDANAAEAATDKLLADFSEHSEIAVALCWVGDAWRKAGNHAKAIEVYNRVLTEHRASEYALWSQAGVGMSYVQVANLAAAEQAAGKLRTDFSGDPRIATAMCMLADEYRWRGKYDRACELYRQIVETWPDAEHAMWAQAGLAISKILSGDDGAAQAAVERLAAKFSGRERFNVAVEDIAREYRQIDQYDKAEQVYQYIKGILPNWPQNDGIIWWRTAGITSDIAVGQEVGIQYAIDSLISDFNDDPELPKAVFQIGLKYYSRARLQPLGSQVNEYYRKAIAVWERIIQDLPACETTPRACYVAAVCYSQELGEYAKGIQYYQRIVDNWPDYRYAWHAQYFVGMYYSRLKGLGLMEASEGDPLIEKGYRGVVERYPDSESAAPAALSLAQMSSEKGLLANAAKYYEVYLQKETAERDRSGALKTVYDLGQGAEKRGEFDSAARLYAVFIMYAEPGDQLMQKAKAGFEKSVTAAQTRGTSEN